MYCRCVPIVFHLEGSGVNWVSLKGVTGEEVPLGDLQAYANAIDTLLSHPDKMKQYAEASHQRVLDMFTDEKAVCQMNKIYLHYLIDYRKNLKQRNALLKQISEKPSLKDTLEIWNEGLIKNGKKICYNFKVEILLRGYRS